MTDLSEDPRQWPDDPRQWFGLTEHSTKADLRKSYAQLIRRFRPETHPQPFQEIHEAYQWLLKELSADTQRTAMPEFDRRPLSDLPSPEPSQRIDQHLSNDRSPQNNDDGDSVVAVFQDQTIDFGTALQRAEQIAHDSSPESSLAMFWLTRLTDSCAGDADTAISMKWLRQGVANMDEDDWQVMQLLQMEVECNPAFALSQACSEMIATLSVTDRLSLLRSRWHHAASAGDWQLLKEDLERHRADIVDEQPGAWAQRLLHAVQLCAWHDDLSAETLTAVCRTELREFSDLELQLHHELDRLDQLDALLDIATDVQCDDPLYERLMNLLPDLWLSGNHQQFAVEQLCQHLSLNSSSSLADLTNVVNMNPMLGEFLYEVLDSAGDFRPWNQPPDVHAVADRVLQCYTLSAVSDYEDYRQQLLDFCLTESLQAETVASVLDSQPDKPVVRYADAFRYVADAIYEDLPLRILCRAALITDD